MNNNFENELDKIRIKLYEETSNMGKDEIVKTVNVHAQKIAQEFGIHIVKETSENYYRSVNI
jgi:stress response protein YsnF